MTELILKRGPIGWNQDDCDVLEDGVIVGRIGQAYVLIQGTRRRRVSRSLLPAP